MSSKKTFVSVVLLTAAFCSASPLRAGIVINMVQSGANVVATLSGSINSLPVVTQSGGLGVFSGVRASGPVMSVAFSSFSGVTIRQANYYTATLYPTNFGSSETLYFADSSTASATMMFRNLSSNNVMIDQAYVLGTPVTGTMTWLNKSFASLGVTQGSYVWGWAGDSMTFNIGAVPSPVPEPGTWAAAALLAGTAGFMRWRRRKSDSA